MGWWNSIYFKRYETKIWQSFKLKGYRLIIYQFKTSIRFSERRAYK